MDGPNVWLTPAYAFAMLMMVSLYRFMGKGPFFDQVSQQLYKDCKEGWWAQLIYIGNMYPVGNYCFSWGWYMQCDMQFYIFTPFILLAFYRSKALGAFILCFLIASNMAIVASLTAVYDIIDNFHISMLAGTLLGWSFDYSADVSAERIFQYDTYYTPYCRMAAYVIGMGTGFIVYETGGKLRLHKFLVFLGWILSIGCALAIIYSLYPSAHDNQLLDEKVSVVYQTLARPLWCFSMAWLTLACVWGYGGPIAKFLSWPVFLPLGRLTFGAYLLHPLVISWYGGTLEQPEHFLVGQYTFIYLGVVVISYGLGYVLSVSVETPFAMMLKVLFPTNIKRKTVPPPQMKMKKIIKVNPSGVVVHNPYA